MEKLLLLVGMLLLAGCGGADGKDGAAGVAITSNKIINTYTTNMCTQFAGETCLFGGGQLVKYSDGTVLIMGSWVFNYANGSDTDSDQQAVTMLVPPTQTGGGQVRMSAFVARGTGYKSMYLVYYRAIDGLSLVYDSNGNGTVDGADTVIAVLSTSTW